MVTTNYQVNFKLFNFGVNNPATKVCAGDGYSAVLTEKGDIYSFGKGSFGRLGNGNVSSLSVPKKIRFGVKFKDIACGGRHMLAKGVDGELYGWGYNFYNQIGVFNGQDYENPVNVDIVSQSGRYPDKIVCGMFNSSVVSF